MPPLPDDQADDQAPDLPPDLARIAASADAKVGEATAEVLPPAGEQPGPDRAAEFAAMLQLAVGVAAPALPFLPACYPPETCQSIAVAFMAVADKYGWRVSFDSPELALAVVALPPTFNAIAQGRIYFAQRRADAERAERAARAAAGQPGGATVVPMGAPPHAGVRMQPQPAPVGG